jgi:hypothetical protein
MFVFLHHLNLQEMNAKETLDEIKKEKNRVRKSLQESNRRCQELLWAMEEDVHYGQERMDGNEARKIAQDVSIAEKIIE